MQGDGGGCLVSGHRPQDFTGFDPGASTHVHTVSGDPTGDMLMAHKTVTTDLRAVGWHLQPHRLFTHAPSCVRNALFRCPPPQNRVAVQPPPMLAETIVLSHMTQSFF